MLTIFFKGFRSPKQSWSMKADSFSSIYVQIETQLFRNWSIFFQLLCGNLAWLLFFHHTHAEMHFQWTVDFVWSLFTFNDIYPFVKAIIKLFRYFYCCRWWKLTDIRNHQRNRAKEARKMWILAMFIKLIAKPDYEWKLLLHNAPIIIIIAAIRKFPYCDAGTAYLPIYWFAVHMDAEQNIHQQRASFSIQIGECLLWQTEAAQRYKTYWAHTQQTIGWLAKIRSDWKSNNSKMKLNMNEDEIEEHTHTQKQSTIPREKSSERSQ